EYSRAIANASAYACVWSHFQMADTAAVARCSMSVMSLLRGRARTEARVALGDLSERYLRLRPSEVRDTSLAQGLSGIALAHAVLERALPGVGHRACAERALGRAIDSLGLKQLAPGLHTGVAGIGWMVARLVGGDDACA